MKIFLKWQIFAVKCHACLVKITWLDVLLSLPVCPWSMERCACGAKAAGICWSSLGGGLHAKWLREAGFIYIFTHSCMLYRAGWEGRQGCIKGANRQRTTLWNGWADISLWRFHQWCMIPFFCFKCQLLYSVVADGERKKCRRPDPAMYGRHISVKNVLFCVITCDYVTLKLLEYMWMCLKHSKKDENGG